MGAINHEAITYQNDNSASCYRQGTLALPNPKFRGSKLALDKAGIEFRG
jgi:hypothetical protein